MKALIVGGGLAGLALAERLQAAGSEYLLVEARRRFGGRIKTVHHGDGAFDMGPAWYWPGQPRIAALLERLGLETFEQYSDGAVVFEDERGQVQHGRGIASMPGSWRVAGGLGAVTDALVSRLPKAHKRCGAAVAALSQTPQGITATFTNGEVETADRVVLALPPRIAAKIEFTPALPTPTVDAMNSIATWMAGQAKAIAIYDSPFWRHAGLSGDAQSRHGPMVEMHDASPATGGPYGLFGFIGVPPQGRVDDEVLRDHLLGQLGRVFGRQGAEPLHLFVKDWAFDPQTATQADQHPLYAHPTYGLPRQMRDLWNGRLLFGGTEVAPQFGGYVEGALEAAENVLRTLETARTDAHAS